MKSFASHTAADGSFSLGLSTTVLPQAMAEATIHSGTITGKLKGVIAATTPTGCLTECTSTTARDLLAALALEKVHESGRELDVLDAARHFAGGIPRAPCVLGGDDRGELGRALLQQLAQAKNTSARLIRLVSRQAGRAAAAAAIAVSTSAADAKATCLDT